MLFGTRMKICGSTDEDVAKALVDDELRRVKRNTKIIFGADAKVAYMWDSDSGTLDSGISLLKQLRDSYHNLDETLIFSNHDTTKEDYATKKLNYPLAPGDISAYDKLMSVLYSDEERHKIEWAIGAIITGDSKKIQKFIALYGEGGTGNRRYFNIIASCLTDTCAIL